MMPAAKRVALKDDRLHVIVQHFARDAAKSRKRVLVGQDQVAAPGRQGELEVRGGPGREVGTPRSSDARAQRPEGTTLTILRPDLFQPSSVEAHEVAEPFPLAVEGRLEERRGGCGEALDLQAVQAQLSQEHGQQQGAGVVVGAVPLGEVGDGVAGVLEEPGGVGQALQVVQAPVRQVVLFSSGSLITAVASAGTIMASHLAWHPAIA